MTTRGPFPNSTPHPPPEVCECVRVFHRHILMSWYPDSGCVSGAPGASSAALSAWLISYFRDTLLLPWWWATAGRKGGEGGLAQRVAIASHPPPRLPSIACLCVSVCSFLIYAIFDCRRLQRTHRWKGLGRGWERVREGVWGRVFSVGEWGSDSTWHNGNKLFYKYTYL